MLFLSGDYFDGEGSKRTKVRLELDASGLLKVIAADSRVLLHQITQDQIEISSRLGNGPRYLNLPDGQTVETLENDAVDQWQQQFRPGFLSSLVHRLESNMKFVLLTLVLVIMVVWGTMQFGVPATSNAIARALPAQLLDRTSQQTLGFMEQYWLQPSQLSSERQQQLQQHFSGAVSSHSDLSIEVLFRSSESIGANAFALPNGQIVFTDAIIGLAVHDDELLAILAHEIGHVKHRHSMRRLVQNSLYIFVLAMITGDMSGTSEAVLGLPVLFAELAYSRGYETESDLYALSYLQQNNIPPHRFSDLMLRMSGITETPAKTDGESEAEDSIQWNRYLSTHPLTEERIKIFQ